MTPRDPVVYAHDLPSTQSKRPSRHRRAQSTASTRSTPSSKRSPSPMITFTARPLSPEAKGVKNITRKVIETLEGLGHLDSTDMGEQDDDYDSEQYDQREVELVLNASASAKRAEAPQAPVVVVMNGRLNGSAAANHVSFKPVEQIKKIDWEIPRKALHSSIGVLLLAVRSTSTFAYNHIQVSLRCTSTCTKVMSRP
jgi:diacylglycerol kinase (CTP)